VSDERGKTRRWTPGRADYEECWDLTYRVEQLRELVGQALDLDAELAGALEDTLARLVRRQRVLRGGDRAPEDPAPRRAALEALDRRLLEDLPPLLARLREAIM
jgi:hypothetical protein